MKANTKLLFVGDIALGGDFSIQVERDSSDWISPFEEVRPVFLSADLRIGNLEEPLVRTSTPKKKRNLLGASPAATNALSYLGFSALSLGNNHSTDQGTEGITRTREILTAHQILPFGAGENLATARKPAFVESCGEVFAFLAYAVQGRDVGSEAATLSTPGCVPFSLEEIQKDILDVRKDAHHIVVSLHWGYQYDHYPDPEQMALARKIIDLGAVIVYGHHPHVLQGMERYKNGLILYSLGNFFFPNFVRTDGLKFKFPKESQSTAAVLCEVSSDGVESFSIVPLKTDRDYQMRVLSGVEATREMQILESLSKDLEINDYNSFWRKDHNRTEKRRWRQEEVFKLRSELSSISEQLYTSGFIGSLKKLNRRNINETYRLCRRFFGLLGR